MEGTMEQSIIPYDVIMHEAMLTAVKKSLKYVQDNGGDLPGRHHFYISFKPKAKGVVVPERLKALYPDEMCIVLQNRFSHLSVNEEYFSVRLTFGGIPETITVPYKAITKFLDPSVEFALEFDCDRDMDEQSIVMSDLVEGTENVISVDFGKR